MGSCSIKTSVVGKFSSPKGSNIQFKSDSTFIFEYRAFHLYQYSLGKWKMLNKNLISLTSDIESTVVPLKVKNTANRKAINLLSIDLKIQPSKSLSDYRCGVYVNGLLQFTKRCDSISSLVINVPIDTIYFHFTREPAIMTTTAIAPPIFTRKYVTENSKGNEMEIEVDFDDSYFYYRSFDTDTVKTNGHNLKMYDPYRKNWDKLLRVSPSTNLFSRFNDRIP